MIKVIYCIRRHPDMSVEEFHRYWLEEHGARVRACAKGMGIVRYTQSHDFRDDRLEPLVTMRPSEVERYDGIAEVWWTGIDAVIAAGQTREGRAAGRELVEDEARFIDVANSTILYAEEHVILG
jgi:hypothetical protein